MNTQNFIEKANSVHKNKYNYSNSNYINDKNKIEIICPKHGSFYQRPSSHLSGQGCAKCVSKGKKASINNEKFIEISKKNFGDFYIFDKLNYISSNKKVKLICPIHGDFEQIPNNHFKGHGCSKCANNSKLTTEEFIQKANSVHLNKYDYSLAVYKNNHTKISIICSIHGVFYQNPSSHLSGMSCKKCSEEKGHQKLKMKTEDFIQKANQKHNYFFDYSKVEYKNCDTKINIICPKHGNFFQTPYHHLKDNSCPKCNASKGEQKIREFLIENNFIFEEQKKFKSCRRKKMLPFDFYIESCNLLIEYQGEQHYKEISRNKKKI